MNSICIAGQLGKDAEIRYLTNGDPVASFSVADNQGKDKQAIWWSASLYGKRAESLAPYLVKGQAVTITGTVTEREFTDKDGHKRKAMDVRVGDVALQGGKREGLSPVKTPDGQVGYIKKGASGHVAGFDEDQDIPF
jgi:single-strand DNA-binding protein